MLEDNEGQSGTEDQNEQGNGSQGDTEGDQGQQGSDDSQENVEDLRKKAKAFDDQKKRAEKAEAELRKLKPAQEQGQAQNNNGQDISALEKRVVRAELSAAGIKDPAEQEFVIGAAKRLGIEPGEAANDPIVSAKLEKMREEKATKDATPSPTKRGGGTTSNITSLAEKALKTGELPTDPELRKKVQSEMKRISKN